MAKDKELSTTELKAAKETAKAEAGGLPKPVKLVIGTAGIYTAFVYYGLLQEDVLTFEANGEKFTQGWLLQTIEAGANVLVGFAGRALVGGTPGLPLSLFAVTGTTQVAAKYFLSLIHI